MEIESTIKFKSVDPLPKTELPNFVIITGLNGAGKTQLLQGIYHNQIKLRENEIELNPRKYVTNQTLVPNDSSIITSEMLKNSSQNIFNQFNGYIRNKENSNPITWDHFITDQLQRKLIIEIAKNAKKKVEELIADDFYKFYPLDDGLENKDVFYQSFSNIFKRYQVKLHNNQMGQFLKKEKGIEVTHLSDEEFILEYGESPWLFVNKIIHEAKLDYHINSPDNHHPDAPFELKLINNFNKAEINFSDLSSGEKVLMSLALALYNSKFDREFPKVLLLDEPDASLHPSMVKQFLDVIQTIFVQEKKVKVIMTTHSPSTIAIANEEALFVMNKTGTRIQKTNKDRALKILTTGVPSLSINYENRRQVFVESPNDVLFYEEFYQKLSNYLVPEISLCFISSGESKTDKHGIKISNCEQVISITKILRKGGNNFIWGIIDRDKTNESSDFVKVLGNGNRYAIENYIFDPILVSGLLLREKIVQSEAIGLAKDKTYFDFKNFNQEELQGITNFITSSIKSKVEPKEADTKKCILLNGIEIEIPIWYLDLNGHILEETILRAFPELNALKKGKEEALKLEIINKVIDDIPELVSIDLLDVLKNVQAI